MTQTTLITGGGSGIGLRLAELLANRGHRLAILDRTVTDEARTRLPGAAFHELDVRDAAAVTAAVDDAKPRLVVNSAGIQLARRFDELTESDFQRVIDVNLLGSRNVAAAAFPHLEHGGRLVLIASLAGLVPNYGYAAYCASKYGVVGLAEVLRLEGRPRGIGVSCVCPPEVETPMVEAERRDQLAPSKALKDLAGRMELDPAARAILKGIDRGDFLIVPSVKAKGARLLGRVVPSRLTHALSDRIVARELDR
jgi:NAD(P)-dependent dehydrogenase (short-subunit alcohol dehydrogenase family)